MSNGLDLQNIQTNFYTLARLPEIKYIIIKPSTADDQILFTVEGYLRAQHTKLLATIFAKELHIFSIDKQDPPTPSQEHPINVSSVMTFQPKSMFKTSTNTPTTSITVLCISFLRALKKLLVLNLTVKKEIVPFGSVMLLSDLDILEIEPQFTDVSDVGISITRKPKRFNRLSSISKDQGSINSQNVIYLAPSGIRVYLVDDTIAKSTTSKPSNHETIATLLLKLHSITINPDTTTWIKVIPNLTHLNGMTTQISHYFKPIMNVKYLVWPLELCYVQKSLHLIQKEPTRRSASPIDPLSLIDDFVNLKASAQTKTPSAVPTANNTPLNIDHHQMPLMSDHSIMRTPQSMQPTSAEREVSETPGGDKQTDDVAGDGNEWDSLNEELFGDGDVAINDSDFDFFDSNGNTNTDDNRRGDVEETRDVNDGNDKLSIDVDLLLDEDELADDLANELEMLIGMESGGKESDSTELPISQQEQLIQQETPEKNPYDIPLHEMTLSRTPTPYQDPGAPLPIQSPRTQRSKSIFSPLNFNPIIKSNVDDKYADGGKFFVKKPDEIGNGGDSVVSTVALGDSFGHDEGDVEDDDEDDDDDYEDYDDEDDNDEDYSPATDDAIMPDTVDQENRKNDEEREMIRETSTSLSKIAENLPDASEPDSKKLKLGGQIESPLHLQKSGSNSPSESNSIRDQNGVPNCMPFILRSIPFYTIPEIVFDDNPTIEIDEVDTVIDELLNQIVWNDTYVFEDIPNSNVKSFNQDENIERSIAQIFPDIHKTTLLEFAGAVKHDHVKNTSEMISIGVESPLSSFQGSVPLNNGVSSSVDHGAFVKNSSAIYTNSIDGVVSRDDEAAEKKESSYVFPLKPPKMRVKRIGQDLSVNSSSLYLWNLLSFRALNKPKDFKVLMITTRHLADESAYFLSALTEIYDYKFQLGRVEKISVGEDIISEGLLIVDDYCDLDEALLEAGKSLKAKFTSTEKNQELLVLFPDGKHSFTSTLADIQKYQKLKSFLKATEDGQDPFSLNISLKMIPSSFISNNGVFSTVSINQIGRLSLNIYNSIGDINLTFTQICTDLPETIEFKLTKQQIAADFLSQHSYIHLSYDRSVDKEWIVAAWTDGHSTFRKTKAWYCSNNRPNDTNVSTIEQVMNDIWDITSKFSSKMKGKKHLILTRLNGMIPDDELLHLKRLSPTTRDLTLVVVSASCNSRLLLEADEVRFPITKVFNQQPENEKLMNGMISKDSAPTVGSSTGLTPSMVTPQGINSPDLFTMNKNTNVPHESPSSNDLKTVYDEQNTILDINDTVYGVMIDSPETLINSPNRFGIKTGYLVKPVQNSPNYIRAFEVNLLSCPANLKNDELMKTILTQFRNLSTISELFSVVGPTESLLPWHVEAVRKVMHCLVHVRVNQTRTNGINK